MPRDVYLQGRGLASALGADLVAALRSLREGAIAPRRLAVGGGEAWPYFEIPDATVDWHARGRELVRRVVAESGIVDRSAPLFVASSSLNVGALEDGSPYLGDCQAFVEQIAAWLEWRGPVAWVSTACTSSLVALQSACALVRSGGADRALVLGVELRNRYSVAGFGAMQLLEPDAPRPLAADRGGLVLGEAVAALAVGADEARWRIAGGANLVDGANPAGADRAAVARMIREALDDAALAPHDIGVVKLQAAGSPHNDAEELAGLREVFADIPPLVTVKHWLGHTLGAAGAAELALLAACAEAGLWPASPPQPPDPALAVRWAEAWPRARHLLATILGFGGGHACVVLEDCAAVVK